MRCMYAGAQSRCNSKGRILLVQGSTPIAGPQPSRHRLGPFPIGGIRIQPRKDVTMLYTIAVVLLILWLLGLVSSYTMGGLIHVLLVIAIVVVLLRVISGRRPI